MQSRVFPFLVFMNLGSSPTRLTALGQFAESMELNAVYTIAGVGMCYCGQGFNAGTHRYIDHQYMCRWFLIVHSRNTILVKSSKLFKEHTNRARTWRPIECTTLHRMESSMEGAIAVKQSFPLPRPPMGDEDSSQNRATEGPGAPTEGKTTEDDTKGKLVEKVRE